MRPGACTTEHAPHLPSPSYLCRLKGGGLGYGSGSHPCPTCPTPGAPSPPALCPPTGPGPCQGPGSGEAFHRRQASHGGPSGPTQLDRPSPEGSSHQAGD